MSSTKGMSKVKKAMKVILIILLIIAVLAVLLWFGLKKIWNNIMTAQMAPDNYTSEVKTGGELEAKYMAMGSYEVNASLLTMPMTRKSKRSEYGILPSLKQATGNILLSCL